MVVKVAAWVADISWPVIGVQNGNSRLVTEAARIPALTLAVGAQLVCVTGTTDVDGVDSKVGRADAADGADGAVADISFSSLTLEATTS
jgi:hypothetical protein